jgi:polysaccharide chain length determinant protein (PEP-CTERM system associated)
MLSKGTVSISEIKRLLRHYWWILPITIVLTGVLGFAATLVLPKKYTSSTMVLVEPPAVDPKVLPENATEDLYRDLSSMRDQILSRSRLQPILTKFNVFPKKKESDQIDDLIDQLKQDIEVELIQPLPGSISKQPPGFHVSVTLSDPVVAQQVCTELTSMFMQQNTNTTTTRLNDTNSFLAQELADAKTNLDETDAKLAQFKREHLGTLPEEEQSNMGLLTGMNAQLEATTQSISRAQQDKTFNESLLAEQVQSWKAMKEGVGNADTLDTQLASLQDQLSALLAKYTPEHPDVVKTKAEIEELKRRMATMGADAKDASSASANATPAHEPPQIQQMRAKIKQDEINIADLTRHQAQIQRDIGTLQAHLQASPVVEQQMKELTRNYQTALDHYNDLLKDQQKSVMLTDLQGQQKAQRFRVLDQPNLPTEPSFPKKVIFVGGGLGAGLALGAGILYLIAMADKTMYTEQDIELCLKLPVLTLVPSFEVMESPSSSQSRGKEIDLLATKA